MKRRPKQERIALANDASGAELGTQDPGLKTVSLAMGNDGTAVDDDGWALVAPFGEWPKTRVYREAGQVKEQKFVQVLDNESADALLSKENSFFRKLKRAIVGIPVYRGHGDLNDVDPAAIGNETQKIKLGVVDQVRKSGRGVEVHFALDNDGAEAVEKEGLKYPSAFWYVVPIANGTDGKDGKNGKDEAIRCRPFKLISVCLTAHPNISGVESLANARHAGETQSSSVERQSVERDAHRETQQKANTKMKELLIGWLAAKGTVLANDASEGAILKAVQDHCATQTASATALGNEKTTLNGQVTILTNERDTLKRELQTGQTALGNEQTARKAERKGRAEAMVDLAIHKGIVTVADRDSQVSALENSADFKKDSDALLAKQATTKTTTNATAESGKQGAALGNEASEALGEYQTAFAAALPNAGQDPIKAHQAVMLKFPALAEKLRPKKH